MTNKKSQELSINTIIVAAIALIVLIILVALFTGRFDAFYGKQYYCKQNPDECVCEEWCVEGLGCQKEIWTTSGEPFVDKEDDGIECKSYRRKPPQELEIDYCNENPEDKERCVCEENKKYMKVMMGIMTVRRCEKDNLSDCETIVDKTESFYDNVCTKANPKTECGKGNPDWVEEIYLELIEEGYLKINQTIYEVCSNQCYKVNYHADVRNKFYVCDNRCKMNSSNWVRPIYQNKTTCREKTVKEKCIQMCEEVI